MNYTHDGFTNDVYHTYEVFKVQVSKPPKKKVEVEVEVKEKTPSPREGERKKQFSTKVGKMKEMQRKIGSILNDEKGTIPKIKTKPKGSLPTEDDLIK